MKMVCHSTCIAVYTDLQFVVSRMDIYPPYAGITIGFYCPGTYFVNEDAGNVSVTVEILRGTPARDVIHVLTLQTADSSAIGKVLLRYNNYQLYFYLCATVFSPVHMQLASFPGSSPVICHIYCTTGIYVQYMRKSWGGSWE